MNSNAQGNTNSGANQTKIQSFLEALRASQAKGQSDNSQENSFGGRFSENASAKELEKRRSEQFFNARQQEWNRIFSAKEKQAQQRIEEIRFELQKLAKQVKRLDANLSKAVSTPIIDPGAYHESYFQHIKKVIHLFSLKVNSANSWLEMYNSRSAKKGAYWGMAKTHGTSFTMNNERAIATSVG